MKSIDEISSPDSGSGPPRGEPVAISVDRRILLGTLDQLYRRAYPKMAKQPGHAAEFVADLVTEMRASVPSLELPEMGTMLDDDTPSIRARLLENYGTACVAFVARLRASSPTPPAPARPEPETRHD